MSHLTHGICKQNTSSDTDTACRCLIIPALERQLHSTDRGAPFPVISRFPTMGLYWCKCASKASAVGRTLLCTGGRERDLISRLLLTSEMFSAAAFQFFLGQYKIKQFYGAEALWDRKMLFLTWCLPVVLPSHHSPSVIQEIPWNDKSPTWTCRSNYISGDASLSFSYLKLAHRAMPNPCRRTRKIFLGSSSRLNRYLFKDPKKILYRLVLSPSPNTYVRVSKCAHCSQQ